MTVWDGPVLAIGAGNMGGAILRRWLDAGLAPSQLTVVRRSGVPFADGVETLSALPPDGAVPALVLLGVKPQMIDDVAADIAPLLAPETVLVSILAGVELASLRRRFPEARLVRAMPNTPVAIGQGVIGLCGDGLDHQARERVDRLMAPLGLVEWVNEAQLDAVTAVAGSGPAFLYRFIDALTRAGREAGLEADAALRLATSALAADMPEAADDDLALAGLIKRTVAAAVARNREMAAAARK